MKNEQLYAKVPTKVSVDSNRTVLSLSYAFRRVGI